MYKRSLKNKFYYILFVAVVLVLSTGYAYLNSSLFINGTSIINANIWSVGLDNLDISTESVSAISIPTVNNSITSSNFEVKLENKEDLYDFTVDVVNNGDYDARLNSLVEVTGLTEEQKNYFEYTVNYENNESIQVNQLVKKDGFVRLRVRVSYKESVDVTQVSDSAKTLKLGFNLNYDLDNGTGVEIDNNGKLVKLVSGNGTNVGDEVCFGKECFYVISSDNSTVTMLSKYNLLVGNKYDPTNGAVPLENPTGIQDSSAKGGFSGYSVDNPVIGSKQFSSTNYWSSTASAYPAYVYNENSYLYEDLENYKKYLKNQGVDLNTTRLIAIEELESLGCSVSGLTCVNAPSWVYSSTYWSGSAYSSTYLWRVNLNYALGTASNQSYIFGVRPVITVPKYVVVGKVKPVADGDINEIGTVVTIGSEQFYTIGTEGDNVKLFAKYNLLVGNKFDDTNGAVALVNPTGVQDETAKGWFSGYSADNPIIGTKPFSSTNYWSSTTSTYPAYVYNENSYLYEYIENYKRYLKGLGAEVNKARLITINELEGLGCSFTSYSCSGAPSWVYSTTYWTGDAYSSTDIWRVYSDIYIHHSSYTLNDRGVRPIIVISKDYF